MKRTTFIVAVVVSVAGSLILKTSLLAWVAVGATWSTSPVRYFVNPANAAGLSNSAVIAALQTASSAWSTQSKANFRFSYGGATTLTSIANDGLNTVVFRPDADGSVAASTYTWWDANNHLLDADIVIWESDFQFFTGTTGCINGLYLEDIATHEFGHALGLAHSSVPTATMYPSFASFCAIDWRYLDPDDIAGVEALYPPTATLQPPTAPSGLSVSVNAANPTASLVLAWSDNASTEDGSRVDRSVDDVTFSTIAQLGVNASSYSDSGLAPGATYFYRISAYNSAGASGYSNVASGRTQALAPPPAPSADGTLVPPAPQIVDLSGAIWTLGANLVILRNGATAAGGLGSKILWSGGVVYVLGIDANWWKWTGSAWTNVGATQPGGSSTPSASPDGTMVPPATQIVDAAGAVWTIGTNLTILQNGSPAARGRGSKILWFGSTIYVLGTDANWYKWMGAGWMNVGATQPGGSSAPGASPDGTMVPPATQIVDTAGAVWTIGTNQTILRNGAPVAGGLGSRILWSGSVVYVLGIDANWWKWTGAAWTKVGPVMP